MKFLFTNSLARKLLFISFGAVGFIIVYLYLLVDIPEVFSKAAELGELMYGFAISYLVAALFYFIVELLPLRQRKKSIISSLEIHLNRIEQDVNSIIKELDYPKEIVELTIDGLKKEDLQKCLENTRIDYRTNINYLFKNQVSIVTHMETCFREIEQELADLGKHVDLYSPALFRQIKNLQSHLMRRIIAIYIAKNQSKANLGGLTSTLFGYIKMVQNLRTEWEKNKREL